ncbi:FecR domain-containing protein [Sphingobacterium sp. PCS056]|uniref:FecR family protein n=1 Tax=Sphingobacterium sp. PCS056 TaxID=2931400 RepID=UPI00200BD89A|nr:FecR domain-containing protein [Sphingobacterium sp. PCS056]UPZ37775.1 FecR domain-containing protein [Sphingobacterium sp. PCS056]
MEQDQFITLLNKYLQGQLSIEENRQFQQLLQSDSKNQVLFDYVHIKSNPSTEKENEEEVFQSILTKIDHTDQMRMWGDHKKTIQHSEDSKIMVSDLMPQKPQSWYQVRYVAAAVIVPLLMVLSFYLYQMQPQTKYAQQYVSKRGEKKIINLSDGTTVWLNGDSKLYLEDSFGKVERRVKLEGEGFFTVAHDREHPFIVEFKDSEVKVLGTKFNIRAYPDEDNTATSLVEGAITMKVDHQAQSLTLKPGDKVTFRSAALSKANAIQARPAREVQHSKLTIQEGEVMPSETLWLQNKLSFHADPLSLVISKLSKWYNVSIAIENPDLEQFIFSGNMEGYRLDQILLILQQANPNIQVKKQHDSIIIH